MSEDRELQKRDLAERLRTARAAKGLSQQAAATAIGVAIRSYQYWEDPKRPELPRLDSYDRLCRLFGWTSPLLAAPESSIGYFTQTAADLPLWRRHSASWRSNGSQRALIPA